MFDFKQEQWRPKAEKLGRGEKAVAKWSAGEGVLRAVML